MSRVGSSGTAGDTTLRLKSLSTVVRIRAVREHRRIRSCWKGIGILESNFLARR